MKLILTSLCLLILLWGCSPHSQLEDRDTAKSNLEYVDPYIGGMGHLLHPTRPNVQLPNQMVRMHPMRNDFLDDQISFFPLSIISHRKGELFGILPGKHEKDHKIWRDGQMYDHDLEIVRPFYLSTYLIDDEIITEYTTGAKSGYFRFTFPDEGKRIVKLQINHEGEWNIVSANALAGEEVFFGMKAYVYGEFNQDGKTSLGEQTRYNKKRKTSRQEPGAWFDFSGNTNKEVEFRYGISFISVEQARKNMMKEIADWDFDALKIKGEEAWNKVFNRIMVKGGTEAQKRVLYTSLYRTYERMINVDEYGKHYSAYDHKIHDTKKSFYVDDWVWDTYITQHPLRMILHPDQQAEMLQSYVDMYKQYGWMPQFPLLYQDDPAMHGFHSTVVFLDAWRKGIRDFDMETAYEGMRKNAYEATMLPWRNGPKNELDHFYRKNKFYPSLNPGEKEWVKEVHDFERRQSVAITLAHCYDDWALAQLAKEFGKKEDYAYLIKEAANYRNHYNPEKKLMWPKNAKGEWLDIDPKFDGGPGGRDYYDENNGYTYAWQAQHDIHGLIKLMGGREGFIDNLDQLFREDLGRTKYQYWAKFADATGMVGQYSMGNEPSFHIPYLYNYAGEPWKTQKKIRFLLDAWFQDNIFGIPGDEDGGAMTAFVVFSSLGFYPVTPGLPVYTIGSPLFEEVTIDLDNGNTFTIKANNCSVQNKYIQSAKLNGETITRTWFTHEELVNGATLELEMAAYPNKNWGTAPEDAPPSSIE